MLSRFMVEASLVKEQKLIVKWTENTTGNCQILTPSPLYAISNRSVFVSRSPIMKVQLSIADAIRKNNYSGKTREIHFDIKFYSFRDGQGTSFENKLHNFF